MPENLYPKLPSAPSTSQESFNIEMVRKTIKTFLILKQKYTGICTSKKHGTSKHTKMLIGL